MSYSELLTVVNSDPTKTLDKLFLEHRGVGSSDAPLKLLGNGELREGVPLNIGSFKMTVSGSVRIIADTNMVETYQLSGGNIRPALPILNFNGNRGRYAGNGRFCFDMNVEAGQTYVIQLSVLSGNAVCYASAVCGSLTDTSFVE